jgi:hypothetical protein
MIRDPLPPPKSELPLERRGHEQTGSTRAFRLLADIANFPNIDRFATFIPQSQSQMLLATFSWLGPVGVRC